jgi:raffinose/stachyose/melibiose transport system substrate-binding protein
MSISVRRRGALVALAAASALLAACGGGSSGSSTSGSSSGTSGGGSSKSVKLTYLIDNQDTTLARAKAVISAFEAANPGITVETQTRPQGSAGDNIVKTRLSTGDMPDVFAYNNGSLFQALKPEKNLVPLSDQSWANGLNKVFVDATTASGKLYGAPDGTAFGGAILYNIPIYKKLGLQIPQTWDQFMANNAKIKAAGIAPVIQTYGNQSTWTSQLFVLGDFHNVAAKEPDWATRYTNGQVKYATDPVALEGFQHLEQLNKAGYFNKDYRSAQLNDGLKELANGQGAQYPMLGGVAATIEQLVPGKMGDIGFFPIPGSDASSFGMTIWSSGAVYIPTTTKGDKLDAAKKFLAFIASPQGCDAQTKGQTPTGPYMVNSCTLPANVSQVAKDTQTYLKSGKSSPALEFLSPIKGPALEQITVEVGSGIRKAPDGARLYDEDVKKQAQQLGLPGW